MMRSHVPQSAENWGKKEEKQEEKKEEDAVEKEEANFEVSGLLAMEDNSRNGIALKFTEPPDSADATDKWRLYVFKNGEEIDVKHMHRQRAYLFGKDRRVADIGTDHPTCSKQHAVVHYRRKGGIVVPYIMDLESTNGTFLNTARIDSARYYELKSKDMLTFGSSKKEFILINADEGRIKTSYTNI